VARLGDLDLDFNVNDGATPLDVPIDDIIIHEMYNPRENTNDIAILKLKNNVSYGGKFFFSVINNHNVKIYILT